MDTLSKLAKATTKILCNDGSAGTGFFFSFKISDTEYVPTIITNKHVIENAVSIKLVFSLNDYFSSKEKNVNKLEIDYVDFQKQIVFHKNSEIDLCAIIIVPIIQHQIDTGIDFQITYLDMNNIPSNELLENLRFVEDIIMVGYPNGISDVKNNLPIFRRGSTSTHPGVDFEGRPECIIDMTITPGSSGSPVFIYNSNGFTDNNGNTSIGTERLIFLGINKAVYIINSIGEMVEEQSPTKTFTVHNIGINLGIIIKSTVIKDLEGQVILKSKNQM